jgi:hypothetical protein
MVGLLHRTTVKFDHFQGVPTVLTENHKNVK